MGVWEDRSDEGHMNSMNFAACLWFTKFSDICFEIFMNKAGIFDEKRARSRRELKELTTDDIKDTTTSDFAAAAAGDRDNQLSLYLKLKRTNERQEVPPEMEEEANRITKTPIRKKLILWRRRRGVESRVARKRVRGLVVQPETGFNGTNSNSIGVANEMFLMYPDTKHLEKLLEYNLGAIWGENGVVPTDGHQKRRFDRIDSFSSLGGLQKRQSSGEELGRELVKLQGGEATRKNLRRSLLLSGMLREIGSGDPDRNGSGMRKRAFDRIDSFTSLGGLQKRGGLQRRGGRQKWGGRQKRGTVGEFTGEDQDLPDYGMSSVRVRKTLEGPTSVARLFKDGSMAIN